MTQTRRLDTTTFPEIKALLLEDRVSLSDVRLHVEHEMAMRHMRERKTGGSGGGAGSAAAADRSNKKHYSSSSSFDSDEDNEDIGAVVAELNAKARKQRITGGGGGAAGGGGGGGGAAATGGDEVAEKLREWSKPVTISEPSGTHAVLQGDVTRKDLSRVEKMWVSDRAPTNNRRHLLTPRQTIVDEGKVRTSLRNARQKDLDAAYSDMSRALMNVLNSQQERVEKEAKLAAFTASHQHQHQQQQQQDHTSTPPPPPATVASSPSPSPSPDQQLPPLFPGQQQKQASAAAQAMITFSPIRAVISSVVQTPPLPPGWKKTAPGEGPEYDYSDKRPVTVWGGLGDGVSAPPPAVAIAGGAMSVSRRLRQLRNDAAQEQTIAMGGSTQQRGQLLQLTAHMTAKVRRDMTVGALTMINNTDTYKAIKKAEEKKRIRNVTLMSSAHHLQNKRRGSSAAPGGAGGIGGGGGGAATPTIELRQHSTSQMLSSAASSSGTSVSDHKQQQQQQQTRSLSAQQQQQQQQQQRPYDRLQGVEPPRRRTSQLSSSSSTTATTPPQHQQQQQNQLLLSSQNSSSPNALQDAASSVLQSPASTMQQQQQQLSMSASSPTLSATGGEGSVVFADKQLVRKSQNPFINRPDAVVPWTGAAADFVEHCTSTVGPMFGAEEIARTCFNLLEYGLEDYHHRQRHGAVAAYPWEHSERIVDIETLLREMVEDRDDDGTKTNDRSECLDDDDDDDASENNKSPKSTTLLSREGSDAELGHLLSRGNFGSSVTFSASIGNMIADRLFARRFAEGSKKLSRWVHKVRKAIDRACGELDLPAHDDRVEDREEKIRATAAGILRTQQHHQQQHTPHHQHRTTTPATATSTETATPATAHHHHPPPPHPSHHQSEDGSSIVADQRHHRVETSSHEQQQQQQHPHHDDDDGDKDAHHQSHHSHTHNNKHGSPALHVHAPPSSTQQQQRQQQQQQQRHQMTTSSGVIMLSKEEKKLLVRDVFGGGGGGGPSSSSSAAGAASSPSGDDNNSDDNNGATFGDVVTKAQGMASMNAAQKLGVLEPIMTKLPHSFLFSKSADTIIRGFTGVAQQQEKLAQERSKKREIANKIDKKIDESVFAAGGAGGNAQGGESGSSQHQHDDDDDAEFHKYVALTRNTRQHKREMKCEENFGKGIVQTAQATLERMRLRHETCRGEARTKLHKKLEERRRAAESVLSHRRVPTANGGGGGSAGPGGGAGGGNSNTKHVGDGTMDDIAEQAERRAKVWKLLRMPPESVKRPKRGGGGGGDGSSKSGGYNSAGGDGSGGGDAHRGGGAGMWETRLEAMEKVEHDVQQCRLFCMRACLALFATAWPPTEEAIQLLSNFCDGILKAHSELTPSQFYRWLLKSRDLLVQDASTTATPNVAAVAPLERGLSSTQLPQQQQQTILDASPSTSSAPPVPVVTGCGAANAAAGGSSFRNITRVGSEMITTGGSPSYSPTPASPPLHQLSSSPSSLLRNPQQQQQQQLPWDCMFLIAWIRSELGVAAKAHAAWCELAAQRQDGWRYDSSVLG